MDNNKKPNEPPEAERWAKSEDLDRKIEEEEAERWVRIEKSELCPTFLWRSASLLF